MSEPRTKEATEIAQLLSGYNAMTVISQMGKKFIDRIKEHLPKKNISQSSPSLYCT